MITKIIKWIGAQEKQERVLVLAHSQRVIDAYKTKPDTYVIGINDHAAVFGWTPDLLICIDPIQRFGTRASSVIESKCPVVTHLPPSKMWANEIVEFKISGRAPRVSLSSPVGMEISYTSPFVGAQVAYWLGAKEITVAGVDLFDHPLYRVRREIERDFLSLRSELSTKGVELLLDCRFGRTEEPSGMQKAPRGKRKQSAGK